MKINFFGWYGRHNSGDEAFKLAHAKLFPDVERIYTVDDPDYTADHVILGGGDVIKPFYLEKLDASKPFSAIGCGLGYESEAQLLKAHPPEHLILRNRRDIEVAHEAGLMSEYCPDLAFLLEPTESIEIRKRKKKKSMAVVLSDSLNASFGHRDPKELAYSEYYKWTLADSLTELLQWYDIHFLVYSKDQYSNDHRMAFDVAARMKGGNYPIIDCSEPQFALNIMKSFDLALVTKFHSLLFGTIAGTPMVNLGVTRKTSLFCQENGLADYSIEPYSITKEILFEKIKLAEEAGMSEELLEIAAQHREHWDHLTPKIRGWFGL